MRDLIKELENLKYAGKLIPEAPLFRGDFTPLVRIRKTHKWFRLMKNNDGQHFMSENSKPFQLADEDLTNVFVSLAKIIGQVELIINGQYGELT